jgi:transposase
VERTGSYGARLARLLADHGEVVLEVSRPDRRLRRDHGKSDPIDAEAAARAVLAGTALGQPKQSSGVAASLRQLRAARQAAVKARTQAANQLRALLLDAPEPLHALRSQSGPAHLASQLARLRPATTTLPIDLLKHALRSIAHRWLVLDQEARDLEELIDPLVRTAAPRLLARPGVGPDVAATLCGVSPLPASSGRTHRHRPGPRRRPPSQPRPARGRAQSHAARPAHATLLFPGFRASSCRSTGPRSTPSAAARDHRYCCCTVRGRRMTRLIAAHAYLATIGDPRAWVF